VAVVLSSANVVGYTKCSKQASAQLRDMARNAMTSGLTVSGAPVKMVFISCCWHLSECVLDVQAAISRV